MKQYLKLLKDIKEKGTYKAAARENMPGTTSLFGYQMRFNLQEGFPILTTKKMYWKGIVAELIWFLNGDTNIKYLIDNGVNIWNEDAYNYYLARCKDSRIENPLSFDRFIDLIASHSNLTFLDIEKLPDMYELGDCGSQYGKVWRNFGHEEFEFGEKKGVDQIKNILHSLKNSPEGRRHIVTAIDPTKQHDLALYWCHAMFQFNCRKLTLKERVAEYEKKNYSEEERRTHTPYDMSFTALEEKLNELEIPKYYLDCQLYQRSADAVLGVPFNISSYALLTSIMAESCNMVPGDIRLETFTSTIITWLPWMNNSPVNQRNFHH